MSSNPYVTDNRSMLHAHPFFFISISLLHCMQTWANTSALECVQPSEKELLVQAGYFSRVFTFIPEFLWNEDINMVLGAKISRQLLWLSSACPVASSRVHWI